MTLFLDTSAFIARYFPRDQYHVPAMRAWASLAKTRVKLFTTDFVIAETMRAVGYYATAFETARVWRDLLRVPRLTILHVSADDQLRAADLLHGDLGPIDCTSFIAMRRQRLKRVFTFDDHFVQAEFEVWPE